MRAKIIACETVGETVKDLIPADMPRQYLQFGLHLTPDRLHTELQRAIDETAEKVDAILLGYGMCSKGAVGLESRSFKLVIPKLDDCIAIFLGSRAEYAREQQKAPGTFYLTKGWIECGDDPYSEYLKLIERHGQKKAYRLEKEVIRHYTRLALINPGDSDIERYRKYAQQAAVFFDLIYEELPGSNRMIKKLLRGEWDEEFVIVEPGGRADPDMFW